MARKHSSHRSGSAFRSAFKRYAAYRTIRGTEEAVKGTGKAAFSIGKFLVGLCALLIAGYCLVIALPVMLGIAAVVVVVVLLVKRHKKKAVVTVEDVDAPPAENPQKEIILRHIEIMRDCENLVNNSATLEVVARRYNELLEKLDLLMSYPPDVLTSCGISFPSPLHEQRQVIVANKIAIFNQAIDRALEKEKQHIATLKTDSGKSKAIVRFYNDTSNAIRDFALPDECLSHLEYVCRAA